MKIFALIALLLVVAAGRLEAGTIVNGSFENVLTGWVPSNSLASTVTSYDVYAPIEQSFFALLEAGNEDTYTTLSQNFSASAGQTISGYGFFVANDVLPFNDDAYVKIFGDAQQLLFSSSVLDVGDFGVTIWTSFAYTFLIGGNFTIEAGVRNVGDGDPLFASVLGLDDVQLSPEPVPEPTSVLIWSLGAIGVMFARRSRRFKLTGE